MNNNPNKKAGNWGALKTKPQNLVPFKSGGKVKVTAGGEKHVIYKKTTKRGEGKVGDIMVNHPTTDKGVWDTIDLTKKAGAKTIQQGVASTKKWHKENPYNDMKKQLTKKYQNGGNTAADKVEQQRAINAKRKEEALARTEKSKTDARAKIDQAQKNKPVVKPAEPVAQTTAPVKKNSGKDNTKAQIGVRTQAYNYEDKGITKNKINILGRGVTKSKTDKYLVPAKDVRFSDTDSPSIVRRKLSYLNDRSDQQKTGTQKTRTVTNPKKGTVKTVTRSKGSYVKDGEKKRVVTKSMIPSKSNSDAMKKGGTVNKKVIKSASGNYRATQKPMKAYPNVTNTTGLRRTIKGAIKGVPTVTERVAELKASKTKDPRYTNPMGGGLNYIMSKKTGGTVKKYQTGGPTPKPAPYMDRATKAKMNSPKTKALEGQFKNIAPKKKK